MTTSLLSRVLWVCFIAITLQLPLHAANLPDWVRTARIANAEPDVEADEKELDAIIAQRKLENVSVLELDPGFSEYHTDAQFTARVNLIKKFTDKAHANGMKTVTYIPAVEVNTPKGEVLARSMYKDHPDWIQKSFKGEPAVFYGSQEDWVEPQMESSWMSPNTGYREYFLKHIKEMASSGIDGIWVDTPIYYPIDEGSWGGNEPAAIAAFKRWANNKGLGQVSAPTKVDWNSKDFKLWINWRYENMALFIDDIRKAAQSVNPNIVIIDEVFPVDNMDTTMVGLDESKRISNHNHINVWEIDSVSNKTAMKWSNQEDFINKITMYKWMRGIDRENPSWAFSYGHEELDASLVMGSSVTVGVSPFESKTPSMAETVKSSFRTKWFGFIKDNEVALLKQRRVANVGIWYSSATRDYQDFKVGGSYGMFNTYKSPNNDASWWGGAYTDTPLGKPHLGGYRGAAYALSKLHVPYKVIAAPGKPSSELQGVQFLWLPSVAAISDADAETIKAFVKNGGTVFATGTKPGVMDHNGILRNESILKGLFNLSAGSVLESTTNSYGKGVAIYDPETPGAEFFRSNVGAKIADENLSYLDEVVREHSDNLLIVKSPSEGIHVEVSQPSNTKHYIYAINFSGLKLPLVSNPLNIDIQYYAPEGYEVVSAKAVTTDTAATKGSVNVKKTTQDWYGVTVNVDQFSLIELTLRKVTGTETNKPPVANVQSVSLLKNTSQAIALKAIDPEGKVLTYSVTTQPTHGKLTGVAPSLTYTVNKDYIGTDSFSFKANDGVLDSNIAVVSITVKKGGDTGGVLSNPVKTMKIDGDLADWSGVTAFTADAHDITAKKARIDWIKAQLAHSDDALYLAYENYGDIDTSKTWLWEMYLDTDQNSATGYKANSKFGAEYVIQGSSLYRYTGSGADWKWTFVKALSSKVKTKFAELAIPTVLIGKPAHINIAFFGNNSSYTGNNESVDFYPEQNQTFFQYKLGGETTPTNHAPVASAINMATKQSTVVSYEYKATDSDGDKLTYTVITKPKHGVLEAFAEASGNESPTFSYIYRPNTGYVGTDSFTYKANDGKLDSNTATASIKVSKVQVTTAITTVSTSYLTGETISVNLSKAPGNKKDWIGIYKAGATDKQYLSWVYTNGLKDGVLNLTKGVATVGSYEVRLFKDDGYELLAKSRFTATKKGTGEVISNPVTAIKLDGDLSDWSGVTSFARDPFPSKITPSKHRVDWMVAQLAHTDDTLYMSYENMIAIDNSKWWLWETYLDTDQNAKTGYKFNGKLAAEYVIQGGNLYSYSGTGTDWKWTFIKNLKNGVKGKFAEVAIPTALIGNPAKINLAFFGNNASYATGGKKFYPEFDFYPNADTGFFQYKLGDKITIPPAEGVISNPMSKPIDIQDNRYTDWSEYTPFPYDLGDKDIVRKDFDTAHIVDWMDATFAHDSKDLYVMYVNAGLYSLDEDEMWRSQVYLDTDNNPATGSQDFNGLGADYVLLGNEIYKYVEGDSDDWDSQWQFVSEVEESIHAVKTRATRTWAFHVIPRELIGNPQGEIGIQFYGETDSDLVEDGSPTEDFYPNEGLSYLKYKM